MLVLQWLHADETRVYVKRQVDARTCLLEHASFSLSFSITWDGFTYSFTERSPSLAYSSQDFTGEKTVCPWSSRCTVTELAEVLRTSPASYMAQGEGYAQSLHLRVGPALYLQTRLRVANEGSAWFGASEMDELLALLHRQLPCLLPTVLARPQSFGPEECQGESMDVRLFFQPTSAKRWLLNGCDTTVLGAVPFTLLVDVHERAKGACEAATLETYLRKAQ